MWEYPPRQFGLRPRIPGNSHARDLTAQHEKSFSFCIENFPASSPKQLLQIIYETLFPEKLEYLFKAGKSVICWITQTCN